MRKKVCVCTFMQSTLSLDRSLSHLSEMIVDRRVEGHVPTFSLCASVAHVKSMCSRHVEREEVCVVRDW